MNIQKFPSRLLEEAVNEFSKLPGIGSKSALRLVLHLLRQDPIEVERFSRSVIELRNNINYCVECNNISDSDTCEICSDKNRDSSMVCVVESIKDVMAIEATHQFHGVYHVLGGIISPVDGIGPSDLKIDLLKERLERKIIREMLLALSTTMEGDTTNFYLYRKFKDSGVKISTLARGISFGGELEYADELTLGRSILNRTPFDPGR